MNNKIDIFEFSKNIKTKKDFEEFLKLLVKEYKMSPGEWENNTLESYLEALQFYTQDIEGYYSNMNISFDPNNPTWKNFADILLGAIVYE